jgi:hypothetical protein
MSVVTIPFSRPATTGEALSRFVFPTRIQTVTVLHGNGSQAVIPVADYLRKLRRERMGHVWRLSELTQISVHV